MPVTTTSLTERLCAVVAAGAGQDPICTAGSTSRLMAVETPAPWGEDLHTTDESGSLAQRVNAIRAAYFDEMRSREGWEERLSLGIPHVYGIQPDKEWSRPDSRRVLLAIRPDEPFSEYAMAEYAFPSESMRLVDFAEAFFRAPEDMGRFEEFRVPHGGYREFFVCTHGQVDICCAKFGIPLYNQARAAYPHVRAWRMTHFGGHRFAPTAWEFPAAYKWAFLGQAATQSVLAHDADTAALADHLRGWSGAPGHSQILDREGFKRYGWRWLSFRRRGQVIEADADARRWRARLDFESPEGERGAYEGTVIVARELHAVGCGPHAGEHDFQVPEYALESLSEP